MSNVNVNELLARCVEIEKAALAALSPAVAADAVPYFIHVQESFPYFTNRIGNIEIGFDSNEMDRDTYTVVIRLVVAHVTTGFKGAVETDLYTYIPAIITAFNKNEGLQSAAYTTAMTDLIEGENDRVISCTGFRVLEDGGLQGVKQVCAEFILTCLFNQDLDLFNL